ncbi:MAG: putative clusterin-associated protein 1, partial [Streblomastix strix]
MSIWEMRTFIETMKTLGYPKLISYASFRQPNFELVSEAAHWLLKRSDPTFSYPYEISTENDRVALINTICNHAWSKIHIRLNSRKLYAANDECVHELCKFAKILGDASRETPTTALSDSVIGSDIAPQDAKDARQLAQDITQEGARLSDNLDAEHDLKRSRIAALQVPMEPELAERVLAQKNIEAREEVENLKLRLKELETDKESLT